MGWTQQSMQDWEAKLYSVEAAASSSSPHLEWLSRRIASSSAQLWCSKRLGKPQKSETGFRVSFPLRVGLNAGASGGVDHSAFALQLLQLKVGAEIGTGATGIQADHIPSQRSQLSKLGRNLEIAGDVANAASILL